MKLNYDCVIVNLVILFELEINYFIFVTNKEFYLIFDLKFKIMAHTTLREDLSANV